MNDKTILGSMKTLLGISEDFTEFDETIRMHVDSIFVTLHQLGVGPKDPFYLEEGTEKWSLFMEDAVNLRNVKSYMGLRLRLLWDMPQNAFLVTSIEKQIQEFEWRMTLQSREEDYSQNGT